MDPYESAETLLRSLGAEDVPHPGGTLMAHLLRVRDVLSAWGARPELRLAGLCHAAYGTDGFAVALLPLADRPVLAGAAGAEAERLVHLYASCDRGATAPDLSFLRDRFTGETAVLPIADRRDFAELTAANELDLAAHDPAFRTPGLLTLLTRWRPLLSPAAWRHTRFTFGDRGDHPG